VRKKLGRPLADARKDAVLSVRMTDAEYADLLAHATAAREELADYVRHRLIVVNNNSGSVTNLLP
jgi:hypothetical protein